MFSSNIAIYLVYGLFVLILMYELFLLTLMYEIIWLNSAAIIIYYIWCTNGAILIWIYFLWKKDHHYRFVGLSAYHRRFLSWIGGIDFPSPPVQKINLGNEHSSSTVGALITNGLWTDGDNPPITVVFYKPAVMEPLITIDLNPTLPKPAVIIILNR